jgi:hypothetical protein
MGVQPLPRGRGSEIRQFRRSYRAATARERLLERLIDIV